MTAGPPAGVVITPELEAGLREPTPFVRPLPAEAYAGQGRPSTSPFGVMYIGEYETLWDGTAVAVRAHARALAQANIPVFLKSFSFSSVDQHGNAQPAFQGLNPQVKAEVGHLELTRPDVVYPVIKHAVIQDAEHLKQMVMPRGAVGRSLEEQTRLRKQIFDSTILYTVWERDRVDPGIVKTLSKVAENWVPSSANAKMLVRSGVPYDKVKVVPHPYDPADPILNLRRRRPDTEWKKFYSIGRWEPRKGYVELIDAFLQAFTPRDNVILTIKYTGGTWPGYETPQALLARINSDPALLARGWSPVAITNRIRLIEGRFPQGAIQALHYKNNLYVSSSHGEAWCLPAFEAALAGNNVCYVPSGGVEDYLGNGHTCVAPNGLVPVPKSYRWESDAEWMGYDQRQLVIALQQAQSPTVTHDRPDSIALHRHTLGFIGEQMRKLVIRVAQGFPKAAEYYAGLSDE